MVLEKLGQPLQLGDVPKPKPGRGQLLVRVTACAVCRTDLHIVDGELPEPKLPLILGHQIVAYVEEIGPSRTGGVRNHQSEISDQKFTVGDRVGIPWLGWTDGDCVYCRSNRENLCDEARFTGYTIDGGYAEFTVADARFCFRLPDEIVAAFVPNADVKKQALDTSASTTLQSDVDPALATGVGVAPLLCAGLIGYRAYRKTGQARRLGIYGFGNAARLISQIALYEGRELFVFTRSGDTTTQQNAKGLGAKWAGGSDEMPPEKLDAAIIFASVGPLVPAALRALVKGGVVVCGGIHMSDIPSFPYVDLWNERVITSVANLTRQDGKEFFEIAPRVPVQTRIETFPLEEANVALEKFRCGQLKGTAVLVM